VTSSIDLYLNPAETDIETQARFFATGAHEAISQKRKFTGEPYWYHCARVAYNVRMAGGTHYMITAAWLHDTVEDTGISLETIRLLFGDYVADYVEYMTNLKDEKLTFKQNLEISITRLKAGTLDQRVLKLADIADNLSGIEVTDINFAMRYLAKQRKVIEAIAGDCKLSQRVWGILESGEKVYGIEKS
jgi:(p)ppGpp synthase/HD superfamily hydrolase